MSTQNINRVEADLLRWKEREGRFSKLFSFEMSSNKSLMREKLLDCERISAQYADTKDPAERLTLRMLRQERKHLEKLLYPNVAVRLFRRLVVNPVRMFFTNRAVKKQSKNKRQSVYKELQRWDMAKEYPKAEKMMQRGVSEFSLTASEYVTENERMNNTLSFRLNETGDYQPVMLKAGLHNEISGENREHTFNLANTPGIGLRETYNLLAGRAVYNDGRWIKLDLNDRDTKGNYRLNEFPKNMDYNMSKILEGLPFRELLMDSSRENVIAGLQRGDRVPVTLVKSGKEKQFFIEANPHFKSLTVYDTNGTKVSMAEALGKKTAQILKQERGQKMSSGKPKMRIV